MASANDPTHRHSEIETVQAELAGYKKYTKRVRYNLIPGVW